MGACGAEPFIIAPSLCRLRVYSAPSVWGEGVHIVWNTTARVQQLVYWPFVLQDRQQAFL